MTGKETQAYLEFLTKLKHLRQNAIKEDLNPQVVDDIFCQVCSEETRKQRGKSFLSVLVKVGVGLAILLGLAVQYARSLHTERCLISVYTLPNELNRPLLDCSVCKDLKGIPSYDSISREEFVVNHAYNSRPAVIRQAVTNWTAMKTLSFSYLKDLYLVSDVSENQDDCAFFAYRTDFTSLKDAFESITPEMNNLEVGAKDWYIGWSNCDEHVHSVINNMTKKLNFLPEKSKNHFIWVFVGSPGVGAAIHIDDVILPSWQAQIKGKKTWTLTPPPECEHLCQTINATLNQGDIIVVNTNQWYHSTTIHEGSISLSIGSEYD